MTIDLAALYHKHRVYNLDGLKQPERAAALAATAECLESEGYRDIAYLGRGQDVFALTAVDAKGQPFAVRIRLAILDYSRLPRIVERPIKVFGVKGTRLFIETQKLYSRQPTTPDNHLAALLILSASGFIWEDTGPENIRLCEPYKGMVTIIDGGGFTPGRKPEEIRHYYRDKIGSLIRRNSSGLRQLAESPEGVYAFKRFLMFTGSDATDREALALGAQEASTQDAGVLALTLSQDEKSADAVVSLPETVKHLGFLFCPGQGCSGFEIARRLGLTPIRPTEKLRWPKTREPRA